MSEAAIPAAAAPAAAAPAAPVTPPASAETVTLTKEAHEQLTRDAARASEAQRRADRLQGLLGRSNGSFGKGASPAAKAPEASAEAREEQLIAEDRKAERGLMAVAIDPSFRDVLDADPTLRNLFTQNPLAVLPLLAPDALDAEDAIELVKGQLAERAKGLKKAPAPTAETPKPGEAPAQKPTPPAGGTNVATTELDEKYEAAKKLPNTEVAVAGMIGARLRGLKK